MNYGLLKGTLKFGIPYLRGYKGNPHYFLIVEVDGENKQVLVNTKSTRGSGAPEVLFHIEHLFSHPINDKITNLGAGIFQDLQNQIGITGLDYWRDKRLFDIRRMTHLPFDAPGDDNDLNELISGLLSVDLKQDPDSFTVTTPDFQEARKAYKPKKDVTVYTFGDVFNDDSGMHNVHMNQGNEANNNHGNHGGHGGHGNPNKHSADNGIFQDGAVLFEIDGNFTALFLAFQSQKLPTNSKGDPIEGAKLILDL